MMPAQPTPSFVMVEAQFALALFEDGRVHPTHFGAQSLSWAKPRDARTDYSWLEADARAWNSDPTPVE